MRLLVVKRNSFSHSIASLHQKDPKSIKRFKKHCAGLKMSDQPIYPWNLYQICPTDLVIAVKADRADADTALCPVWSLWRLWVLPRVERFETRRWAEWFDLVLTRCDPRRCAWVSDCVLIRAWGRGLWLGRCPNYCDMGPKFCEWTCSTMGRVQLQRTRLKQTRYLYNIILAAACDYFRGHSFTIIPLSRPFISFNSWLRGEFAAIICRNFQKISSYWQTGWNADGSPKWAHACATMEKHVGHSCGTPEQLKFVVPRNRAGCLLVWPEPWTWNRGPAIHRKPGATGTTKKYKAVRKFRG